MKTTASTGAIITGLSATSSVSATRDFDFEITDRSKIAESEAKSEFSRIKSDSDLQTLHTKLKKNHDLTPAAASVTGFEIETDDPEINEVNPVAIFATYRSQSEHDGFMIALTGTVEDTRQPLTVQVFVSEPAEADSSESGPAVDILSYAVSPEGEVRSEVVEKKYQPEGLGSGVQPADVVGCSVCTAVFDFICDKGTGNMGRARCAGQCMVFGPVGWAACSLTCALLIDLINDRGCTVGAAAACATIGACS